MNCLCCGKTLKNDDGTGWHKACVKRFFMTTKLPDIDIDDQKLKVLAEESINKGYTARVYRRNCRYTCFLNQVIQDLHW